ncbi:MAG: hypothetical protein AAB320_02390 [Elusimicrobiota bacterium]
MNAIELVFDFFEDHVQAAAVVNQRRPLALGAMGFAIGAVSLYVSHGLSDRLLLPFGWASLGLIVLWELLIGFLLVSVLHLILEMGSARGSAAALFVLLGLANIAWALAVPAVLLLKLVAPDSSWLFTAVFFVLGLLSVSLKARSLQDNYHISSGKAWVTLGLPYMAVLAAVILAASLAMLGLFVQIVKAFN